MILEEKDTRCDVDEGISFLLTLVIPVFKNKIKINNDITAVV